MRGNKRFVLALLAALGIVLAEFLPQSALAAVGAINLSSTTVASTDTVSTQSGADAISQIQQVLAARPAAVTPAVGSITNTAVPEVTLAQLSPTGADGKPVYRPNANSTENTHLAVSSGTWSPAHTQIVAIQWFRCSNFVLAAAATDSACEAIAGETNALYRVTEADVSKYLRAAVTATDGSTTGTHYSATYMQPVYSTPANTVSPSISGTAAVGGQLTGSPGVWVGASNSYSFNWYACTSAVPASGVLSSACSQLSSAGSGTLNLTRAMFGKTVVFAVAASNASSGPMQLVTAYSASSVVVASAPFLVAAAPAISVAAGTSLGADNAPKFANKAEDVTVLALSNGAWDGTSAIGFEYRWFGCAGATGANDSLPGGCEVISGATSNQFRVTEAQVGKTILGEVKATNAQGSYTTYSASSAAVVRMPEIITDSVVGRNGGPFVGNAMAATPAVWAGTGNLSVAYQWLACGAKVASAGAVLPANCSPIAGATSPNFTVTKNLLGKFLLLRETAQNSSTGAGGARVYYSASTVAVATVPTVTAAPLGKGNTVKFTSAKTAPLNTKLTIVPGGYGGAKAKYSYAWHRCPAALTTSMVEAPPTCTVISGAKAASYVVKQADVGFYVAGQLLTSTGLSATIASKYFVNQTPSSTFSPVIVSDAPNSYGFAIGRTMSVDEKKWDSVPAPTFSYQWYTCPKAAPASPKLVKGCTIIKGANKEKFVVGKDYLDKFLVVQLNATNSVATPAVVTKFSASTKVILQEPTPTKLPVVTIDKGVVSSSGAPMVGTSMTATAGAWTGKPVPTRSTQWYACIEPINVVVAVMPVDCEPIAGATGAKIKLTEAQYGRYISMAESGKSGAGLNTRWSVANRRVEIAPNFRTPPSVSGTAKSGELLTAVADAAENFAATAVGYQWLRCASVIPNVLDAAPSQCAPVQAANGSQYTALAVDERHYIAVLVKITNPAGTITRVSPTTSIVVGSPSLNQGSLTAPTFPTALGTGIVSTAVDGSWTGYPAPALAYEWFRCSSPATAASFSAPGECAAIAGATARSYAATDADIRSYLRVKVTATNEFGSLSAWSASSAQDVKLAPSFTSSPTLNSATLVGQVLQVSDLVRTGYPALPPSYTWYRCANALATATASVPADAGCTAIAGNNSPVYTLTPADRDHYVSALVRIENAAGAASLVTASTVLILEAPSFPTPATQSGSAWEGGRLTGVVPVANGSPNIGYEFSWYACEDEITTVQIALPTGCYRVEGAPSLDYAPVMADVDYFFTFGVKATNALGVAETYSVSTPAIKERPRNTRAPVLSNNAPVVGAFPGVSLAMGGWTGSATMGYSYQWYACDAAVYSASNTLPANCALIPGANSNYLTPGNAQLSKFLIVREQASNGTVAVDKYSASTIAVSSKPNHISGMGLRVRDGDASTTGAPHDGSIMEAVIGNWEGTPTPEYTYQWYSCPNSASEVTGAISNLGCSALLGQTRSTYTVTEDEVGEYIRVAITGQNVAAAQVKFSASSMQVLLSPKVLTSPVVSGHPYVQANLNSDVGTFRAIPDVTTAKSWWVCEHRVVSAVTVQPADCSELQGLSGTLNIQQAWLGKFISSATTATNAAGSITVWGVSTTAIVPGAVNVVAPSVVVEGAPGTVPAQYGYVAVNAGTWVGDPLPQSSSYRYQWYNCDAPIASAPSGEPACIQISGATSARFQLRRNEVQKYVAVSVYAENIHGGSTAYSATSSIIYMAPEWMAPPTFEGSNADFATNGRVFNTETVTATAGEWDGFTSPTVAYQWMTCDVSYNFDQSDAPADCYEITGATGFTLTVTEAQVGKYLMFREIATNIAGSNGVWSATTVEPVRSGPVNKVAPVVAISNSQNGNAVVGTSRFITTGGTWIGDPNPTLSYEWLLCVNQVAAAANAAPAAAAECTVVSALSSTNSGYAPVAADRGKYPMVHIKAVNTWGTGNYWSATGGVVNMIPENATVPSVTGNPFLQGTVKVSGDTWTAYPDVTRSYSWMVCDGPLTSGTSGCTVIAGANAERFQVPDRFENKYLLATVTATNLVGSASKTTITTPQLVRGPVNTSDPLVTGLASYPNKPPLSVSEGVWIGTPAPTLTYQWYRCSAEIAAASDEIDATKCAAISGATQGAYTMTDADPGNALLVGVTGTNTLGSSTRYTASSKFVTEKVSLVTAPSITSLPRISPPAPPMTSNPGTWRGFPRPAIAYQWYRCNTFVPAPSDSINLTNCTLIRGATASTFSPDYDPANPNDPESELGKFLILRVTASNTLTGETTLNSVTKYSASTLAVALSPSLAAKPSLSIPGAITNANPLIGDMITVTATWNNPQPTKSYQWYRCDSEVATANAEITALPAGCVAIDGATSDVYQVVLDDRGKFLIAEARGSNETETVSRWSNSTKSVQRVPIAIVLPTVSGNRVKGSVLTADPGVWDAASDLVILYQWYHCTTPLTQTVNVLPTNSGCSTIGGATSSTYTQSIYGSDDGKYVTVMVAGQSGTMKTDYYVSVSADQQTANPPSNVIAPKVISQSNRYKVGEIFDAINDTWTAFPSFTRSYQWYECSRASIPASDSLDPACSAITGATEKEWVATRSVAVHETYLMVAVTATNRAASTTKYSSSISGVLTIDIENVTPVSIDAPDLLLPATINTNFGSWTESPTPSSLKYEIVRYALYCSAPISKMLYSIPSTCKAKSTPLVAGAAIEVTSSNANSVFAGSYASIAEFVWELKWLPAESRWEELAQDEGVLRRKNIAISSGYIKEVPGLWTSKASFTPPTVPSYMLVGETGISSVNPWFKTASYNTGPVTWRGSEEGTFTYQWFSCAAKQDNYNSSGLASGCSNISGATSANYVPVDADLNNFLGLAVTATNSVGSITVWTATSNSVTEAPNFTAAPTLSSGDIVGETITLNRGTWRGTPAPDFTYAWYKCGASVSSVTFSPVSNPTPPTGCDIIVGQTGASLQITTALAYPDGAYPGSWIIAKVTATNRPTGLTGGTRTMTVFTRSSLMLREKPVFTTMPSQDTTTAWVADVGKQLTINRGAWRAQPLPPAAATVFRWWACDTAPANITTLETPQGTCSLIPNASASVFTLTSAVKEKFIVGQVVVTNSAGSTYATIPASAQVKMAPVNLTAPTTTTANDVVGQAISMVSPSTWNAFPTPDTPPTNEWYSCSAEIPVPRSVKPDVCDVIANQTGTSLTLTAAMAGRHIYFNQVATNTTNGGVQRSTMSSVSVGPIRIPPHFNTSVPSWLPLNDTHVGKTISPSADVTPFAVPAATVDYRWYYCTNAITVPVAVMPNDCTEITAYRNKPLIIDASLAGKRIAIFSTGTNELGSESKSSVTSSPVTMSPTNDTAPAITGNDYYEAGGAANYLDVSNGTWTSSPAPIASEYTYAWYRCATAKTVTSNVIPADCTVTPVGTAARLPITAAMAGNIYIARVTVTINGILAANGNSATKFTRSIGPIRIAPSFGTTVPTISGTAHVGETLTGSLSGAVGGVESPSTAFSWYSCPSSTSLATPATSMPGACSLLGVGESYVVASVTRGTKIALLATATNTLGSATKTSVATALVTQTPVNDTNPVISGSDVIGGTPALSVTNGTWTSYPQSGTYSYKWYSCSRALSAGTPVNLAVCPEIAGANASTYTPNVNDKARYIMGSVTFDVGSANVQKAGASAATSTSATIGPIKLVTSFTTNPTVSGIAHVGETLTASLGATNGYPTPSATTYEWYLCNTAKAASATLGGDCTIVTGAGNAPYVATSAAYGKHITILASATNGVGATATWMPATRPVTTQSPSNVAAPTLTGSDVVGGTPLSVDIGTWTPSAATGVSYQWYSCTSSATASATLADGCVVIDSATSSSFAPTMAQAGKYLLSRVTYIVASNKPDAGTASYSSATVGPIKAAPEFTAQPSFSGYLHVGATLTAGSFSVIGYPTPSAVTYEWYVCPDVVSPLALNMPNTCFTVGTASSALTVPASAEGQYLYLVATATNGYSPNATARSATGLKVTSTPQVVTAPTISGSPQVGAPALTVSTGSWTSYPVVAANGYTYAWYACSSATVGAASLPAGCSAGDLISGATGASLTLTSAQIGKYIVAKVTATNSPTNNPSAGSASYFAASVGAVVAASINASLGNPITY